MTRAVKRIDSTSEILEAAMKCAVMIQYLAKESADAAMMAYDLVAVQGNRVHQRVTSLAR